MALAKAASLLPYRIWFGLGNPGRAYAGTRHNAGKDLVAFLAGAGSQGRTMVQSDAIMNVCGRSIARTADKLGAALDQILIVHDCLDLPLGKWSVKLGGSARGHNGVRSVIASMGSDQFARLRIGIGRPADKGNVSSYVLSAFDTEELLIRRAVFEDIFGHLQNHIN